ncbi:TPA: hypothetical protein ACPFPS_004614 [Enterobacter hormaechei]|uniref:hypothetical protein n=1 Tax=Enterobacter hormaechei TaxID=158836 RepID=UPI0022351C3A|nr:hypothetical protein [Enterobacter hormaechei]MED5659041.1 hypothetical protein [Enterobacter hormaechei]
MTQARRPSPLQRRVLIVLAALDAKRPGPVATRDIERVLEQGGDTPVYGPNLRASCRRMEASGWLHTLRAPNLQLAVELTDAGRQIARPLLEAEQAAESERRRRERVVVLPGAGVTNTGEQTDRMVMLDGICHMACRADFVVCLNGRTCLQLWDVAGEVTRLEGDPLQVALWFGCCHAAGMAVRMQINESSTPEEGIPVTDGTE